MGPDFGWSSHVTGAEMSAPQDLAPVLVRRAASVPLSVVYLLLMVLTCVVSLFILFYFNRLVASALSSLIRAYVWHKSRAYIDIEAVQLSLLGGRLFFKGFRYHSPDFTILVHSGIISWQYWRWRVRQTSIPIDPDDGPPDSRRDSKSQAAGSSASHDLGENGGKRADKKIPCRIAVELEGFEAFVHNWSPSYDAIAVHLGYVDPEKSDGDSADLAANVSSVDPGGSPGRLEQVRRLFRSVKPALHQRPPSEKEPKLVEKPDLPAVLKLLPIDVSCRRGAVVIGNEYTAHIVVISCKRVDGLFDAERARPLDVYRQVIEADFANPLVQMVPNTDYKADQLDSGRQIHSRLAAGDSAAPDDSTPAHELLGRMKMKALLNRLRTINRSDRSVFYQPGKTSRSDQSEDGQTGRWQGLSRYQPDRKVNEEKEWSGVEYAASSEVLNCPRLHARLHWDMPGPVPDPDRSPVDPDEARDGEDPHRPPDFELVLSVFGGTVTYGPWTDRQRIQIQNVFFPSSYSTADVPAPPTVGKSRVSDQFRLTVLVEAETVVRMPFREKSHDFEWKGKSAASTQADGAATAKPSRLSRWKLLKKAAVTGPAVRPSGWLDVSIDKDSSFTYKMDMMATPAGFVNSLNVAISQSKASSSVNDDILWQSGRVDIRVEMPAPVKWNSPRKWNFEVSIGQIDLFILRAHSFFFIDLIGDWTAGPGSGYYTFVPVTYQIELKVAELVCRLCSNESNVINKLSDKDENDFVILTGRDVAVPVTIPSVAFEPVRNEVVFDVKMSSLEMALGLPLRNTAPVFLRDFTVGRIHGIDFRGRYGYALKSGTAQTDLLVVEGDIAASTFVMYGIFVKHMLRLKENYVGSFIHFRTVEEFNKIAITPPTAPVFDPEQQPVRGSDLDIVLNLEMHHTDLIVPTNLFDATTNLSARIQTINLDVRVTNYYLDLQADLSPFGLGRGQMVPFPDQFDNQVDEPELFIGSVHLASHHLFGLPTSEPTYESGWEATVGDITGELSVTFVRRLYWLSLVLPFGIEDVENGTNLIKKMTVHDMMFVRCRTRTIRVAILDEPAVVLLEVEPVQIQMNDWSHEAVSETISLIARSMTASVMLVDQVGDNLVVQDTVGMVALGVQAVIRDRQADYYVNHLKQQGHLCLHDMRTGRVPFLRVPDVLPEENPYSPYVSFKIDEAASQFPAVPTPGQAAHSSIRTRPSVQSLRPARSTFLSPDFVAAPGRDQSSGLSFSLKASLSSRRNSARTKRKASWTTRPRYRTGLLRPSQAHLPPPWNQGDSRYAAIPPPRPAQMAAVPPGVAISGCDIRMPPGIRAFIKPAAVSALLPFTSVLESVLLDDLVDWVHVHVVEHLTRPTGPSPARWTIPAIWLPDLTVSVVVPAPSRAGTMSQNGSDHINVDLRDIRIVGRLNSVVENGQGGSLSIGSVGVRVGTDEVDEVIRAELTRSVVAVDLGPAGGLEVSTGELRTDMSTTNVGRLLALVDRLSLVGGQVSRQLVAIPTGAMKRRCGHLAGLLADRGPVTVDPVFFSCPAYLTVVPGSSGRGHDSWRMLMRLRSMFADAMDVTAVRSHLIRAMAALDQDGTPTDFVSKWRACQQDDVLLGRRSYLVRFLAGEVGGTAEPADRAKQGKQDRDEKPGWMRHLTAVVSRVVLSCVGPTGATSRVELKPVMLSVRSEGDLTDDLTVALRVESLAVDVHQSLVGTVGLTLADKLAHPEPAPAEQTKDKKIVAGAEVDPLSALLDKIQMQIQVVVSIPRIRLGFQTAALSLGWEINKFAASAVVWPGPRSGCRASLAVQTALSVVSIRSQKQSVVALSARDFALSASDRNGVWKAVLMVESVRLDVKSVFVILAEVADRVVRLDGPVVVEFVNSLLAHTAAESAKSTSAPSSTVGTKTESNSPSSVVAQPTPLVRLAVSAAVREWGITVPFMNSLHYQVRGQKSRAAVSVLTGPLLQLSGWAALGETTHTINLIDAGSTRPISTITLPDVDGTVTVRDRQIRAKQSALREINTHVVVDSVEIDAAEVYHLLALAQKDEVFDTIGLLEKRVGAVVKKTSGLVDKLNKPQPETREPVKTAGKDPMIQLSAHFSLVRFAIHSSAPGPTAGADRVLLDLGLAGAAVTVTMSPDLFGGGISTHPFVNGKIENTFIHLFTEQAGKQTQVGYVSAAIELYSGERGEAMAISNDLGATSGKTENQSKQHVMFECKHLHVDCQPRTVDAGIDIVKQLEKKLSQIDLSGERRYLHKLRPMVKQSDLSATLATDASMLAEPTAGASGATGGTALLPSFLVIVFRNAALIWAVPGPDGATGTDYVLLSVEKLELEAGVKINLSLWNIMAQLTTSPSLQEIKRSSNSALLPEINFSVQLMREANAWMVWLRAVGDKLEILLNSGFIPLLMGAQKSISDCMLKVQATLKGTKPAVRVDPAPKSTADGPTTTAKPAVKKPTGDTSSGPAVSTPLIRLLAGKRLSVCIAELNFDGFIIHLSDKPGRDEKIEIATFKSPGLRIKTEYLYPPGQTTQSFKGELVVTGSDNEVFPSVMPMLIDISDSLKELVQNTDRASSTPVQTTVGPAGEPSSDTFFSSTDPMEILKQTDFSFSIRIQKQNFALRCIPFALVKADASMEEIFITTNTIRPSKTDTVIDSPFLASTTQIKKIQVKVMHELSNASIFNFEIPLIMFSLMNSKHVSSSAGVSAILSIDSVSITADAKRLHDFLVFHHVWTLDPRLGSQASPPPQSPVLSPLSPREGSARQADRLASRFQQISEAPAFPVNAAAFVKTVTATCDLGPSMGVASLEISDVWASSKKKTSWSQSVCVGLGRLRLEAHEQIDGFVVLDRLKIQSLISWRGSNGEELRSVQVQLLTGFNSVESKIAFKAQPVIAARIASFSIMANSGSASLTDQPDDLICMLECGDVSVFVISISSVLISQLVDAGKAIVSDNRNAFYAAVATMPPDVARPDVAFGLGPGPSEPTAGRLGTSRNKSNKKKRTGRMSLRIKMIVLIDNVRLGVFLNGFSDSQFVQLQTEHIAANFSAAAALLPVESEPTIEASRISYTRNSIGLKIHRPSVDRLVGVTTLPDDFSQVTIGAIIAMAGAASRTTVVTVPIMQVSMDTYQPVISGDVANAGPREIRYRFWNDFEGEIKNSWNLEIAHLIHSMWKRQRTFRSVLPRSPSPSKPAVTINTVESVWNAREQFEGRTSAGSSSTIDHASPLLSPGPGPILNSPRSVGSGSRESMSPLSPSGTGPVINTTTTTTTTKDEDGQPQKQVTAYVQVRDLNKYTYIPLEPPKIVVPQLEHMGMATPPIEWIGIKRDKLPNVIHQIAIVPLFRLAREVEDTYESVLGLDMVGRK